MFSFLFSSSLSDCHYHVSNPANISMCLYEFSALPGEDICVSIVMDGAYLVFHEIPPDAEVLSYRQKLTDSNYSLDFVLPAAQLPYALRTVATNVTYRIVIPAGGLVQLAVVNGSGCRSGVFAVATCGADILFGTSELQPRGLPLGSEKCVLILNACETWLDLRLLLTPADCVTVFDGGRAAASLTGRQNATVGKPDPLRPLFVVVSVSPEILARRSLALRIATRNCSEQPRRLFLGPYDPGRPTLPPIVGPVVAKAQFEPAYTFGIVVVAVCFATVVAFSALRYRWADAAACRREVPPSPTGTSWSASSRSVQRINLVAMRI
jgi:hypothetical protein